MTSNLSVADRQILGEVKFEEAFILRVRDEELAEKIRKVLRDVDESSSTTVADHLQIVFEKSSVNGVLKFQGQQYQLTVLNLPSVSECYKSYDDVNFVKTDDIGQVLLVGDLLGGEATSGEVNDGITPPMRNARQRVFREPIKVSKDIVQRVEDSLFSILDGNAPLGFKYKDTEEVWEVDEATGKGKWVPV
jgi:transcription initiation factor TFIID subunit 7